MPGTLFVFAGLVLSLGAACVWAWRTALAVKMKRIQRQTGGATPDSGGGFVGHLMIDNGGFVEGEQRCWQDVDVGRRTARPKCFFALCKRTGRRDRNGFEHRSQRWFPNARTLSRWKSSEPLTRLAKKHTYFSTRHLPEGVSLVSPSTLGGRVYELDVEGGLKPVDGN